MKHQIRVQPEILNTIFCQKRTGDMIYWLLVVLIDLLAMLPKYAYR